jgi:glycosyltransferase involved in cell wall biosynthesis
MSAKEKGVVLVQYNDAFNKFVSLYDLKLVGDCYRIVLEPSTWGYRDPAILSFLNLRTQVIVQAQYGPDFEYIQSLGANLVPLRLGAGDWIDDDLFQPTPFGEKIHDIVMVASWQRIKRHELLFDAVRKCNGAVGKIALIGYPSSGRTREDVIYEAKQYGVAEQLDIYENIPRSDVSRIVSRSKIGVMLTLREGANKGIYECLFSGVPVVISDRNIGVNREHINELTGLAASDENLAEAIVGLLENIHSYAPRQWALKTTGYKNSSRLLNNCLKACAVGVGEEWTQDIYTKKNDTNARYVFERDRLAADKAIVHLRQFLRN